MVSDKNLHLSILNIIDLWSFFRHQTFVKRHKRIGINQITISYIKYLSSNKKLWTGLHAVITN